MNDYTYKDAVVEYDTVGQVCLRLGRLEGGHLLGGALAVGV